MSTTTVLTTEKPRQWLALMGGGKRDDDYVPERLKHAARPATKPDRALQLVFALGVLVPLIIFARVDPAGARAAFDLIIVLRSRFLIVYLYLFRSGLLPLAVVASELTLGATAYGGGGRGGEAPTPSTRLTRVLKTTTY